VGRIKQDRWTGTDGKPHSRVTIVAEHVEFRPEFKKDNTGAAESDSDENTQPVSPEDTLLETEASEGALAAEYAEAVF
jgi:single-strand DNA-binding protein